MNPDTIYKTQPYVKMTKHGPMNVEEWTAINPGLPHALDHFFCITVNAMTPDGPASMLHKMSANTVQEAFDMFEAEFKQATDNLKQEFSKPRIAIPGGPVPPMPPGGPKIQLR